MVPTSHVKNFKKSNAEQNRGKAIGHDQTLFYRQITEPQDLSKNKNPRIANEISAAIDRTKKLAKLSSVVNKTGHGEK